MLDSSKSFPMVLSKKVPKYLPRYNHIQKSIILSCYWSYECCLSICLQSMSWNPIVSTSIVTLEKEYIYLEYIVFHITSYLGKKIKNKHVSQTGSVSFLGHFNLVYKCVLRVI